MKASVNFGQRGFTLVELIMVIVIMGVIGGMVSVFMKSPIDAYVASGHRAALTDVADTAARRISRDLHKALPNSINVPANRCVTFIPTRTGGRYRVDGTAAGLDFSMTDSGFNMLASNNALLADQKIKLGDLVAIYNLGIPGADAYLGENTSDVTATPLPAAEVAVAPGTGLETPVGITSKKFPFDSPTHRFQVIPGDEKVVTYSCSGTNLYRSVSIAYPLVLPTACPSSGQVLASSVDCIATTFDYSGSDLQRNALVRIKLTITDPNSAESVSLYHEVHVNNTP